MLYLTTNEVAKKVGVTSQTVLNWCHEFNIGWKVGGRWRIDPRKLAALLDGTTYRNMLQLRGKKRKEVPGGQNYEKGDPYHLLTQRIIDRTNRERGEKPSKQGQGENPDQG